MYKKLIKISYTTHIARAVPRAAAAAGQPNGPREHLFVSESSLVRFRVFTCSFPSLHLLVSECSPVNFRAFAYSFPSFLPSRFRVVSAPASSTAARSLPFPPPSLAASPLLSLSLPLSLSHRSLSRRETAEIAIRPSTSAAAATAARAGHGKDWATRGTPRSTVPALFPPPFRPLSAHARSGGPTSGFRLRHRRSAAADNRDD